MQWRCVKFQKDHSDGAGLSQKLGCQCKDTQKCSLTNHYSPTCHEPYFTLGLPCLILVKKNKISHLIKYCVDLNL